MKMKNRNYVSKLILKKTSKFLKISICLFAFSLILITLFLNVFFNQYLQMKKDFVDNDNIHIIEISTFQVNKSFSRELNFDDKNIISKLITDYNNEIDFTVINEYQLNFGIENDSGDVFFLYGLDDFGAKFLNKDILKDNYLYSSSLNVDKTTLNIPIIQINEGGLSSNTVQPVQFSVDSDIPSKTPLSIYETALEQTYISFNTYKHLIERIYNIKWDNFVSKYNTDNKFGIQAIYKIFVYVENIKNVNTVAKILYENGYSTNYTFKSFDNFDQSIKNTIFISGALITLVFIIASIYIILSFNSYLRVQQKDMGILKHYGYTKQQIRKLYSHNINIIFAGMSIFMLIIIIGVTMLLINTQLIKYIFIISACVYFPMFIINRIISYFMLNIYVKKDIYTLLKSSKEFE